MDLKKKLDSADYRELSSETKRIVAKDYLISYILAFIYQHKDYRKLVFYGGTCARVVYDLNRLSEDLDMHNPGIELREFAHELENFVVGRLQLAGSSVYVQTGEGGISRFVVKMPILASLGLSGYMDEKLHIKVEISGHKQVYREELSPILRHNQSLVIRHFDKASLMAGEMIACLERIYRKGETEIMVKGRDWYDLWWYLQQGVVPNEEKLSSDTERALGVDEVWTDLRVKLAKLTKRDLEMDLRPFFLEQEYLSQWLDNFQDWFGRYLGELD